MLRVTLLLCLTALPLHAAAPPPVEQWIVVCTEDYKEALTPLIEHRRAQGLRVHVVASRDTASLQKHLHHLCRTHPGHSSILLVGSVPHARGSISRMQNEPTDAPYGCLDSTRLPTVAVGRFPARTADEVKGMVAKTLALEHDHVPHPWRHRLTILAGIPAYNPVVDRLVENVAFARFDRIHPTWTGRAIYTSPSSRFRVPDDQLRSQAIDYVQDGQAILLYLGHSDAQGLYAGPTAAFLDRNDFARMKIKSGQSLFITFGCYGCQLAGRDGEGYGVYAMRNPHGPAAVLGSHGICFAAMVQLACDGLFERTLQGRLPHRLGDCWLAALQGVAKGRIDLFSYRMLDAVDGDPRIPQATQREEHLEMFVLLGDPALRLPRIAEDVDVSVERTITAGKTLRITGQLPERLHHAKVRLTLERTPASVPTGLEPVPLFAARRDQVILANHRRANDFVVAAMTATVGKDGAFVAQLPVPAKLPWGKLTLRVSAMTAKDEALTARTLEVEPPPEAKGQP